jgi:hypothetical protein
MMAEVPDKHGVTEDRRVNSFKIPPLEDCRAAWDDSMGQTREWTDDNLAARASYGGRENGEKAL